MNTIDPVIQKICERIDNDQFTFNADYSIAIEFGATNVYINTSPHEGYVIHLDDVVYTNLDKFSSKMLKTSIDKVYTNGAFFKKQALAKKKVIDNAVSNILNHEQQPVKTYVNLNINDTVRVKLTDHGRKIGAGRFSEDENGWSQWQAWILMETFGQYIGLGLPNPFDVIIQVQVKRDCI